MALDIRTLAVLTALVTAGLAIALFGFWMKDRRCQATLYFAAAMAMEATGFGLLAFRHILSPFVTIIIANGTIALGFIALTCAAALLVKRRQSLLLGGVVFAVHTGLFLYFTYADPNVVARIVVISTLIGATSAYAAFLLFRGAGDTSAPFPRQVMAGVFALSALDMAVRVALTLNAARIEDFMSAGSVQAVAFLLVSFTLCAVAMCAKWTVFADAIAQKKEVLAQLVNKVSEYERLSSVLAHDLRSPAASVLSTLRVLRELINPEVTERHAGTIGMAEDAATRLMQMLDNIMTHNAMGGARPRSVTLLDRVIESVRQNIAGEIESSGTRITVDPDMPNVIANEADLIRIFQNLFQNSIKYRSPDRTPAIHVTAEQANGEVTIRVRDNGAGIPLAKREAIFGMFTRLEGETVKGSGIGLACCRRIADALGGSIAVESSTGAGSVFKLSFPTHVEDDYRFVDRFDNSGSLIAA